MKENWKMKNGKCSLSMPEGMVEYFEYLVNRNIRKSPSAVVQAFLEPSYLIWIEEKKSEVDKSTTPKGLISHDLPLHTETRARHKITRKPIIGHL